MAEEQRGSAQSMPGHEGMVPLTASQLEQLLAHNQGGAPHQTPPPETEMQRRIAAVQAEVRAAKMQHPSAPLPDLGAARQQPGPRSATSRPLPPRNPQVSRGERGYPQSYEDDRPPRRGWDYPAPLIERRSHTGAIAGSVAAVAVAALVVSGYLIHESTQKPTLSNAADRSPSPSSSVSATLSPSETPSPTNTESSSASASASNTASNSASNSISGSSSESGTPSASATAAGPATFNIPIGGPGCVTQKFNVDLLVPLEADVQDPTDKAKTIVRMTGSTLISTAKGSASLKLCADAINADPTKRTETMDKTASQTSGIQVVNFNLGSFTGTLMLGSDFKSSAKLPIAAEISAAYAKYKKGISSVEAATIAKGLQESIPDLTAVETTAVAAALDAAAAKQAFTANVETVLTQVMQKQNADANNQPTPVPAGFLKPEFSGALPPLAPLYPAPTSTASKPYRTIYNTAALTTKDVTPNTLHFLEGTGQVNITPDTTATQAVS